MAWACKLQGRGFSVWTDRQSLAVYVSITAAAAATMGDSDEGGVVWILSNCSDREGIAFWHEDQFQFTSCSIQCSRTWWKETKRDPIADMFADTHTHVETCTHTPHQYTHLCPVRPFLPDEVLLKHVRTYICLKAFICPPTCYSIILFVLHVCLT